MTFYYVIWTADPFARKLGLMAHHHKVDCLKERLDCSVVVKDQVTEEVQNSSECSSEWCLLCCWTFCNQTWYGNATSWAKYHARRLVSCLQVQGHSEGSFDQIWLLLLYLLNCWSLCNQFWIVPYHKLECFV